MIKLLDILKEMKVNTQLTPLQLAQNRIRDYIKNGEVGNLDLENTPIRSLPSGLKVGGNLDLENTPIKSLPPNLKVGGHIYLYYTPITSLPPGLKVGGNLNLSDTLITSLPSDLKVKGYLSLSNTPLSKSHTLEQIKQMIPRVEGEIFI
jgi:hypothetical protein